MEDKQIVFSEDQLKSLIKEMGEKTKSHIQEETKSLKESLEKQGLELQRLKTGAYSETPTSLAGIIQAQKKSFESVLNGNARTVKFQIPNASYKTLVTRAGVESSTQAMRLEEIGQLPTISPVLRSLFRPGTVSANSNGVIRYRDQKTVTRGAATRSEGSEKPASEITWEERTLLIQKIADSIPVTKEALEDLDFMQSEIERLLTTNLALKVDQQLWDGDGTPPNLQGVFDLAPEFVAPTLPLYMDHYPNIFDLLTVIKASIMDGKEGKYVPNVAVMNPVDLAWYKLAKGDDGHYAMPSLVTGTGTIASLRIVESGQVDRGTLLVGDFRFGTLYNYGGVTIEVGHVGNQFLENEVTILAEERLGLLVRGSDEDAFVKVSDIALALGDLQAS